MDGLAFDQPQVVPSRHLWLQGYSAITAPCHPWRCSNLEHDSHRKRTTLKEYLFFYQACLAKSLY